jgi:hypothetical protein
MLNENYQFFDLFLECLIVLLYIRNVYSVEIDEKMELEESLW